jgi:hypothetical protein
LTPSSWAKLIGESVVASVETAHLTCRKKDKSCKMGTMRLSEEISDGLLTTKSSFNHSDIADVEGGDHVVSDPPFAICDVSSLNLAKAAVISAEYADDCDFVSHFKAQLPRLLVKVFNASESDMSARAVLHMTLTDPDTEPDAVMQDEPRRLTDNLPSDIWEGRTVEQLALIMEELLEATEARFAGTIVVQSRDADDSEVRSFDFRIEPLTLDTVEMIRARLGHAGMLAAQDGGMMDLD